MRLLLLIVQLAAAQSTAPVAGSTVPLTGLQALPGETPVALLWVPREEGQDWDAVARLLGEQPLLGITVALSPAAYAEISSETLAALPPGMEFAARLPGDPVLPLVKDLLSPELALPGSDLPVFSRPQDVIA